MPQRQKSTTCPVFSSQTHSVCGSIMYLKKLYTRDLIRHGTHSMGDIANAALARQITSVPSDAIRL